MRCAKLQPLFLLSLGHIEGGMPVRSDTTVPSSLIGFTMQNPPKTKTLEQGLSRVFVSMVGFAV